MPSVCRKKVFFSETKFIWNKSIFVSSLFNILIVVFHNANAAFFDMDIDKSNYEIASEIFRFTYNGRNFLLMFVPFLDDFRKMEWKDSRSYLIRLMGHYERNTFCVFLSEICIFCQSTFVDWNVSLDSTFSGRHNFTEDVLECHFKDKYLYSVVAVYR